MSVFCKFRVFQFIQDSANIMNCGRMKLLHAPQCQNAFASLHRLKHTNTDTFNSDAEIIQYITKHTEITTRHMTPEIKLSLITPRCKLWASEEEGHVFQDPFWAFYWPGGQALTRYILDNPSSFRGRTVLDVGSGCGASAIACKKVGAGKVIANDICHIAAEAIRLNARLNRVSVDVIQDNLIGTVEDWDTVLLGDMFYDDKFTQTVLTWLETLKKYHIDIFIGDPGRVYLNTHAIKPRLKLLKKYALNDVSMKENNGMTHGYVWKLT